MGKIIKKFIKVMSFGGTILENYHSQEEPLSTMIERLSKSAGAGGENFLYYSVISVWKRKKRLRSEKKPSECSTFLPNGPSMNTSDEKTLQIRALLQHD